MGIACVRACFRGAGPYCPDDTVPYDEGPAFEDAEDREGIDCEGDDKGSVWSEPQLAIATFKK